MNLLYIHLLFLLLFSYYVVSESFVAPWTIDQVPLSVEFPRQVLELVAISFSRVSSWPRDQTCISCIAGRFYTAEPLGKPSLLFSVQFNGIQYIHLVLLLSQPSMSRTSSSSQTEAPYLLNNNIIHMAYKICFDQLFVLLVRLPVSRRLLVVKILGVKSYVWILTVPITPHCSRVNCSKKKKKNTIYEKCSNNQKKAKMRKQGNKVGATKHQTSIKVADLNYNIPTNIINISTLNIQIKTYTGRLYILKHNALNTYST